MTALRTPALVLLAALTVLGLLLAGAPGSAASPVHPSASSPVTGNISGPSALAVGGSHAYFINGTGGPAVASDGTIVGVLEWNATVSALNSTNVTLTPSSGRFVGSGPAETTLQANNLTESVTILVQIISTYQSENETTNITYVVQVVTPYVLRGQLVAGPSAAVLPFTMAVDLDGNPVGTVKVPALKPNQAYNFTFDYATTGLSAGSHTFTISLANQGQGLVSFAGGARQFSASFNVRGGPPDYTLWYVAGIVAFLGTLFILATRVAARRRGATRR